MTLIMGYSEADYSKAQMWAQSRGAPNTWSWIAGVWWNICRDIGVRPDVAYAQACKETNFGRFGRAVTPEHHNPCGLKIPVPDGMADNDPNAHQRFPTWEVGVRAQAEHLALYAGAPGFPLAYTRIDSRNWTGATADPRHFAAQFGKAKGTVEGLGGFWAPDPNYGVSIVNDFLNPMIHF